MGKKDVKSICLDCARQADECLWLSDFIKPKGSEGYIKEIKQNGRKLFGYIITACPNYKEGEKRKR